MAEITVAKNGPILVQGEVTLKDAAGNDITPEKASFALCRCGESNNKPFCDGSHRNCGFSPDG